MSTMSETITMQNIHKYCEDNGFVVYDKKAGSNTGMLFAIEDGRYMCNVRFMDLLPGDENDFVGFEVHPGVHTTREYYPMVADYCQQISTELGVIQANHEHGDVFFKLEVPITDHAISYQTIDTVVRSAVAALDAHASTLDALAHGYIPSFGVNPKREIDYTKVPELNKEDVQTAMDSIYHYFVDESNHNIVSCDENRWICQIFTNDDHFNLRADCDSRGLLRIRVGYGLETIKVDDPYHRMMSAFICKESAERKVGTLLMDEKHIYAQTQISLLDGEISKNTMDHIEGILIKTLKDLHRSISLISHGIIPENDDEEPKKISRISSMMDGILGHHRDADDDDEDELSGSFFKHLFGSHASDDSEDSSQDENEGALAF